MTPFIPLAAALALLAGTLPAAAQNTPPPPRQDPGQQFLSMWDLDGNGKVTRDEAREHRADMFAMFDSNGDGKLDGPEIDQIDAFKLGQLDAGMGPGGHPPGGKPPGPPPDMDTTSNKNSSAPQGQPPGPPPGKGGGGFADARQQLQRFDGNGDGQVSRGEFLDGNAAWFKMHDRDGNGVLTAADFGPPR